MRSKRGEAKNFETLHIGIEHSAYEEIRKLAALEYRSIGSLARVVLMDYIKSKKGAGQ